MIHYDVGPKNRAELWRRLEEAFDKWGPLELDQRTAILGVFSETYSSWKTAGFMSSSGPWWNRAIRILEAHELMSSYFKNHGTETLQNWLRQPNTFHKFGGKSPLEFMTGAKPSDFSDLEILKSYFAELLINRDRRDT